MRSATGLNASFEICGWSTKIETAVIDTATPYQATSVVKYRRRNGSARKPRRGTRSMRSERRRWVLLAFRMPREPSTPRIAVWRKLRRLGVAQIVDGLVAVPGSATNVEQMGWVVNDILDADGEAQLWTAQLNSAKQERELVGRLNREVAEAYRDLIEAIEGAATGSEPVGRRQLDRFSRELRDIVRRDHLAASGRDRAERALARLTRAVAAA